MVSNSVSEDEFFASLFEVSPVGVAVADGQGRYVDVNPTYCQMFGYRREELLGQSFALILRPEDKGLESAILDMALRQDEGAPTEWQVMIRSGELRTVRSTFRTLYQADGSVRIITVLADVSALHATIAQLKESETQLQTLNEQLEALIQARTEALAMTNSELLETVDQLERARISLEEREKSYRFIIETAHDGVVSMNQAGLVTGWNQAAVRMFGWSAEEALGHRLSERIIPETYRAQHEAGLQRYSHHGATAVMNRTIEVLAMGRDGQKFPVELSIWTHQVRGEPMFSAFVRDVTERKRAEADVLQALERAEELSELKSRFVAMTSHEFRTPLTVIQSSMDLLRECRDQLGADQQNQLIDDVCRCVTRMKHMLDQALLVEKADERRVNYHPESLDLEHWCQALIQEMARSGQGGERICLHITGSPLACLADERLLHQILVNLLSNGLKYSRVDQLVRLELDFAPGRIRFCVVDQGIGIPEADQARLFQSYFRASNVGSIAGTGLGLAIVAKAVELHGGSLEFASEAGVGSRFGFSLPLFSSAGPL